MDLPPFPDLRRLRAFEQAATLRSLVGAAAALRVSQPAITYLLNQLEADLGFRLLTRDANGSILTERGVIFARRNARCLAQLRSAVESTLSDTRANPQRDAIVGKITGTQCRSVLTLWHCADSRAASEHLGISEQAVLRPVQELERLLSARLVQSSAVGRIQFTERGREFARRLALAAQEIWSAMEEIGEAQAGRRSLRIGALVLSPRLILAEALEKSLAERPSQTVEIVEGSYEELVVLLRDGSIDFIFGALRAPPPFPDLAETAFHEDPYVIVCRRDHPLSRLTRITAKDLAGCDFIFPTAGLRHAVLDNLIRQWRIAPKAQIHTSWLPTIIAMVRSSDRLAVLSRWHVESDGTPDIQCLDTLPVPHQTRYVGITSRSSWLPTPFQRHFMDALDHVVRARRERAVMG